jgi:hypothetical protein
MVYNQQHQLAVANQVVDIIEKNYDIKLLGVNCLTKWLASPAIVNTRNVGCMLLLDKRQGASDTM